MAVSLKTDLRFPESGQHGHGSRIIHDIMRDKTYHMYLDSPERKLLIHSLVELKNQLIQQGRYTDCIDELILKVINAPTKRMKIEYV